ncbi:MAG: toll/interleukin-1 receptor domain-containing protein, partial [Pseudomonadota bacterium]
MAQSDNSSEVIESGNIFISYNRKDTDFRRQLEGLLAEDGYNPDFDEEGIRPGEPWRERLEEMIGASDTFIIILTEHWLASENCRTELEIAEEKEKRIIPVLPRALPETPSADEAEKSVRHRVSKLNYVHFFPVRAGDGGGFFVGSRKLKAELRDNIDQLRLRRRYAERASAWKRQEDDLLSGDQLTQAESWMKKEAELDGVAPDTARYIAASQDAREDAIRNARRIRAVLATFGAFAIIAAVAAAAMSWFAIQSVNLADEDSERLTNAARNWADGKANLVANVGEEDQDESERLLSRASQSLEDGLKLVGAIDRESVRPLRVEISLDLASAELNAEDYADAWETVGAVMGLLTETEPETQAKAFLARALLACELAKETDTRDPA